MDCNESKSYNCYILFKFSNFQVGVISVPWRCYIPNLVKIGPVAIEKKLMNDGRRTPDHDDNQPVIILEGIKTLKRFPCLFIFITDK